MSARHFKNSDHESVNTVLEDHFQTVNDIDFESDGSLQISSEQKKQL